MKRLFIGLIGIMLTICAAGAALLQWEAVYGGLQSCDAGVQIPAVLTGALTAGQLEKERRLARWYNYTLREEKSDTALPGAYAQLLDFGGGKMGYLELPAQSLFLPIIHESENEPDCAVHCFGTALPVGGRGNCPVLRCDGMSVSAGELFYVHILDSVLTYRVAETGNALPCDPQEDLCVLQLSSESGTVYVTGFRMEKAPD